MKKFLSVLAVAAVLFGVSGCSTGTQDQDAPAESSETALVYTCDAFTATYVDTYVVDGIEGCVYLSLNIENTGDTSCTYTLSGVYVDDVSCNTGSGLPISADAGKFVSGAFIVFTDNAVDEISEIEFAIEARDSETFSVLQTSDTITVNP